MRPGRQLAVLGLVFVVLYLFVFFGFGAKGSFTDRLQPKLGLDLVGGTQARYVASVQGGKVPSPASMEEARTKIEQRVNALGVSEAEVVIEGDRDIVVTVAGKTADGIKDVGQAAQMNFRKVIKAVPDGVPSPAPSAPVAPSGSAGPAPGASKAAPKAAASGAATPSAGGQGGGAAVPTPSASAPGAATPTPSAPAAAGATASAVPVDAATIEKIVGPAAWAAANKLTDPPDATAIPTFAKFAQLDPLQISELPPLVQLNVPQITCELLDKRPNGAIDNPKVQAVACTQGAKVLLDVAKVVGTDIKDANPQINQQNQWVVSLDFTSDGDGKWTSLTKEAFTAVDPDPCVTAAKAIYASVTHCLVAVVLDKEIISAPEIQGVLGGGSVITGSFDAVSSKKLADQIKFGALPVSFTPTATETISATLGIEQLKAGLLAAAIGMLLVAVYAFFYYRLLGSVIFLSLILSGLLTFGALVVMGRAIGFTLTLAGIAGFIVSLGVAADSFVIYFERLKDEIHEGRSARSAVTRAWTRARRTIISANTITILAAVVLYTVSIGTVAGFAFALGLATVLDLVVVFLFRHPIMTMFANTRAFLSPRVSGLGRVQRRANADESAPTRTPRAKEA
jgi:preprotein translocase subunit SecD